MSSGTPVELFKLRSLSGAIVFRMGGPTSWKGERQPRTSLSSCEAEIRATDVGSRITVATRNFSRHFAASGIVLGDAKKATKLYNDNSACVQWSHNMTTKSMRWVELPENSIREWVQDGTLDVCHVQGVDNPSDIFTKEIRDAAHFCRLRDSFMCRLSTFLRGGD